MQSIEIIENELSKLISIDTESWTKIYKLMEQVEHENLFAEKYKSYTAWVNDFAERNKINVSLLWKRKKAGKYYAQYEERQHNKGNNVIAMQDLRISPDNIVLVEKIAGNNEQIADKLMDKVIKGDLKRADLKNAWQTIKAEREQEGKKVHRINAHDKHDIDKDNINSNQSITAADIVLAFNSDEWITNKSEVKYIPRKYHIFTEFAVQTGTSRHARRIDILAIETLTTNNSNEINLHGIEIKVSKSDLLNDKKMQEYREFCDYFWLAIPENLIDDAQNIITDMWGIIAIDEQNNLKIIKTAKRYNASFRHQTITSAIIKLL